MSGAPGESVLVLEKVNCVARRVFVRLYVAVKIVFGAVGREGAGIIGRASNRIL